MSESIINKYRPKTYDEVIGQSNVVRALRIAVKQSVAKAFLFSGPSGVGKTTLARITAKEFGCEDIREEDGATNTGIDNVRSLIDESMFRPLAGVSKGIIIDECHALSSNAMKALLKTLEEPPDWAYWFLCTTELGKLSDAMRTRCLHYVLKEVPTVEIAEWLASKEESKHVDGGVIDVCAREANGSPRQALSNLGVCLAVKDRKEAGELLRSAAESPKAFELARSLMATEGWTKVATLLEGLKDTSPESIRHVVRAYVTKVAINGKGRDVEVALAVLEAFSKPFNTSDGISSVVLACGELVFSS